MPEILEPIEFLNRQKQGVPILDVRSPSEFAHARIPDAISFPLFTDEERHDIGFLYKQVSQSAAMVKGLEIAGPKMADFVLRAELISPEKEVGMYCWRGGKRSESMAWLLGNAGFSTILLKGGYKAARRLFINFYSKRYSLVRIGGRTGSGKTRILHALKESGQQVIDLEGMANHRGSAFGHLGLDAQPSNEFFENCIGEALLQMDPGQLIWIEDESRHLGKRTIPQPFWQYLTNAPVIHLDVSENARVQEIMFQYASLELEGLKDAFRRISRRMGPQFVKQALDRLEHNDLEGATRIALTYYDKSYDFHLKNQTFGPVINVQIESLDIPSITMQLIEIGQKNLDKWMISD